MMNSIEFEKLIEGQREYPALDFKASCYWDAKKLIRDILAMSNLPDGGQIVIGVDEVDEKFVKVGVSDDVRKTYVVDHMRDQVGKYADPMVDFDVFFPEDSSGLKFIVIKVYSFRDMPTLCKKDLDKELKVGTIYYRNTNRRTESGAISNINDLRDIIELAAVRLMQRRRSFGFTIPNNNDWTRVELESFESLELVKKIKSKGYCEIAVTSLSTDSCHTVTDCMRIVEKSQVKLNWDLPYFPLHNEHGKIETFENGYQGTSEIGSRKEAWRVYLSENFYIINSFIEDWLAGDYFRSYMANKYRSGDFFFVYGSVVQHITHFYAFLERLVTYGFYKSGLTISINFENVGGRQLVLDSEDRLPLIKERTTAAKNISLSASYTMNQILEESAKLSNDMILKVLEYFQFFPSSDSIMAEQLHYLRKSYDSNQAFF